jgi:hypothetical protein
MDDPTANGAGHGAFPVNQQEFCANIAQIGQSAD